MTLGKFVVFAKEKLSGNYDQRERDNVIGLLMEEMLGLTRHQLRVKLRDELSESSRAHLVQAADLLSKNEPVQYVLGFADFYGMRLKVNHHVLIPRPETEELVDYAIKTLRADFSSALGGEMSATGGQRGSSVSSKPHPLTPQANAGTSPANRRGRNAEIKQLHILDIGTGSGCIAIALKKNLPDAIVTALDSSGEAIAVASENAMLQRCDVKFIMKDFLDEKNWKALGAFDVMVSNPPYVTNEEFSEMLPRVKNFEPRQALIASGNDPFIFYRKMAEFGKKHLAPGGCIFLELNSAHAKQIASMFQKDYRETILKTDLQGRERILRVSESLKLKDRKA